MAAEAASKVLVRPATAVDVEQLGSYSAQLTALHHHWDAARFLDASTIMPNGYGAMLVKQIGKSDKVLLVVEDADGVQGYCWAGMEGYDYMALRGPAGEIYDIFVHDGRRREGLGRKLLQATIAALQALGATQIVLSTAHKNEAGQHLFAALGFRPTMVEMTLTVQKQAVRL